ncbi:MAG: SPFH domain-containing protein [Caldilineaceae bacterium]
MSEQSGLSGAAMGEPLPHAQLPTGREINLPSPRRTGRLLFIGGVILALIILFNMALRNIRPGYVGIVFDKVTHKVTAQAKEPGWAIINPFTQSIQEYPVTIQTYSMLYKSSEGQISGDDSIKVQSSEGQQLNLDVVIQYQVIKDEAGALYEDWGGAAITTVEDRVVRQYTRSQVPVIAAHFGWEEITASKRGEIATQVAGTLAEEFARRHLDMVSFGIREVHLPAALQQALDDKIQAQQLAEQQQYQLAQAKIRAEQDRVEAEGKAAAVQAQAQGETQSIRIRAEAQAAANQLLATSLTPELIRYQQLQRWDGKLPLFQGNSGVTPLVDASMLISGTVRQ